MISSIYSGREFLRLLRLLFLFAKYTDAACKYNIIAEIAIQDVQSSDGTNASTLVPISLDGPYAEFMSSATYPAIVLLLIGLVLLLCVNLRDLLVRMMRINKNITGKAGGKCHNTNNMIPACEDERRLQSLFQK